MINVNYMFRPKWPSSGLRSKVWWYSFTGLEWIRHDGEISASVMFVSAIGGRVGDP